MENQESIIGKSRVQNDSFPESLIIANEEITDKKSIAEKFNSFFMNTSTNLAAKIPHSTTNFESYLSSITTISRENCLTEEELKNAFFSLKTNKSPRYDNIHVNVIRNPYNELKTPLMNIFNLLLNTGIFPDRMKVAKVTPICKKGEKSSISNYRSISVLPCFSKILKRIMYDRLYNYFTANSILFNKQFGFRAGHSTEHALLELIDQICDSFNDKNYFPGIFIDLYKAFDTVDHSIFLKKLEHYGIKGRCLSWFQSYLSNRKQHIEFKHDNRTDNAEMSNIICGVPQGSILGPFLFIIYVNDLCQTSEFLKPIMFADDTNSFCKNKTVKTLFLKANIELKKISEWFQANKLSLNEDKARFTLFHKLQDRDNLPLQLPVLKINNYEIKRSSSIKFLGVMVDEHLNWKDHINVIENKLSKTLGLFYKAKQFLNAKAMKSLYFSFIHSYLTYGNVAWCSTSMNKTKKLFSKQKQAIKIIPMVDIQANLNSDEKMKHLGILNMYKLNLYQILNIILNIMQELIQYQKPFKINLKLENTIILQDTVNTILK